LEYNQCKLKNKKKLFLDGIEINYFLCKTLLFNKKKCSEINNVFKNLKKKIN